MNMLLLVSAVILLVIVLAAPSSQTTTDDETDSSANSETDVIATNAQIQLVNQAKSSDPNERLAAVSGIRNLLSKSSNPDELPITEFVSIGVLPVLVNCLKSKNGKLLVQAARALKSIACRKALAVIETGAVPLLVKLLKSPNLEVCKCTVEILAKIAWRSNARENKIVEAGAVPLLVKLLQSPNMELCEYTAWALKNIAADKAREVVEAGAVPPLVKLLQLENMGLCKEIAWALTNIAAVKAQEVVEAGAVPPLVKLLQSPDMDLCETTAWTLKNIAAASADLALAVIEAGALPPLVELLQSENTNVCTQASLAIGKIIEQFPDLNGIDVEHIQLMMENGFVAPFCNLLERNDEEITLKVLNGIKRALKNVQKREKVIELIDECEGLQKIEQLKTKKSEFVLKMIENIQFPKGCVVCFGKKIETAFIPCGHAFACKECAEKIEDTCPMCRQIISDKLRIYLP